MRWKTRPKLPRQGWLDKRLQWYDERKQRKQREWLARVTVWHKWWAWHPVLIEGTWVCAEYVYRKGEEVGGIAGYGGMNWQYRFGLEG